MIKNQLKEALKDAMRAGDELKKNTIRAVLAAITTELVAKNMKPTDELADTEIITVIKRLVKQRKDAMQQFTDAGRPELAETEQQECTILEAYLPAQASEADIEKAAIEVIAAQGATDVAAAGKLTGAVMKALGGNADGTVVKTVLTRLLTR